MDDFLFAGLLILAFVGLPIALGLLFYFVPKKLGYPKVGKYLLITYGALVLMGVVMWFFKDELFTKGNAKELIEEQGIILTDKFDLKENKSMTSIGDYYHTFTIKVSEKDKLKAVEKIKRSVDFKKVGEATTDFLSPSTRRYKGPKWVQNYETEDAYVREYFQPGAKEGYAYTFRRISVSKIDSEITFEDIHE